MGQRERVTNGKEESWLIDYEFRVIHRASNHDWSHSQGEQGKLEHSRKNNILLRHFQPWKMDSEGLSAAKWPVQKIPFILWRNSKTLRWSNNQLLSHCKPTTHWSLSKFARRQKKRQNLQGQLWGLMGCCGSSVHTVLNWTNIAYQWKCLLNQEKFILVYVQSFIYSEPFECNTKFALCIAHNTLLLPFFICFLLLFGLPGNQFFFVKDNDRSINLRAHLAIILPWTF